MNVFQALLEALQSLASNKLRSALTILGIVIGVAAVIAMLALGRGVQESVNDQLAGMGSNQLYLMTNYSQDVRNPQPLTMEDAQALMDPILAPAVLRVAPQINASGLITYGDRSVQAELDGVTPDYAALNNQKLQEGEYLGVGHVSAQSSVAVLGPQLAEKLFKRTRGIVGEVIRINGQPFRVIGVLESKGGIGMTGGAPDQQVLIPITTAQARLTYRQSRRQVDMILVQVRDVSAIQQATRQIEQILRTRHRSAIGADDFSVFSAKSILDAVSSVTSTLTIFLGGIAAISLLVGGIGIMNIMLVSVTERTREIGLRKAVGATRGAIRGQFLVESALLSLTGGLVGIFLSWLISLAVTAAAAAAKAEFQPVIGLDAVLLATTFSTAIGLFFGFYPANRAAMLQPVEALRSE